MTPTWKDKLEKRDLRIGKGSERTTKTMERCGLASVQLRTELELCYLEKKHWRGHSRSWKIM